jgi:hypothetical protein
MSINVTTLKSSFGKYIGTPASRADIDKAFLVPSITETEFNMIPTDVVQVRRVKAAVDQVLQRFQAVISPAGTVSFTPRSIDLQELKYELELDPDVIEDSYIGFLANPDNNSRKDWLITRYIIEELMIAKGRENFELHEAYKGVTGSITPGTATALGASFNGLGKLIADNIADFSVVTGPTAWPTDPKDFVTAIEEWIESACASSETNRVIIENAVDKLHMSTSLAKRFKQGMREKYNVNYGQINDPMTVFTAENISVKGLPSMSGKDRIFMTFKENRAGYIKRPGSENNMGISEANPYKPLAYAKFWKALGFWHPEYVFVNQLV